MSARYGISARTSTLRPSLRSGAYCIAIAAGQIQRICEYLLTAKTNFARRTAIAFSLLHAASVAVSFVDALRRYRAIFRSSNTCAASFLKSLVQHARSAAGDV